MSPAGRSAPGSGQRPTTPATRAGRRSRRLVLVACGFAAVVLVTSFPMRALWDQHRQLSATTAQLARIRQQNRELGQQVQELTSPGSVDQVARNDYGLVPAGQHAYDVVPPAGSSGSATSPGRGSLEGPPVVPGSARSDEQAGLGGVASAGGGSPSASKAKPSSPGMLTRLWRDLQFWH